MRVRVDWSNGADHMWERHKIAVDWANEAIEDELAVWLDPDPKSNSGDSLRVIGYSPSARKVLTVILVRDRDLPHADFWGANGWAANSKDKRIYLENEEGDGNA